MGAKIMEAVVESRQVEKFRKEIEQYDWLAFEIRFPKDNKELGIAKGPRGFYQVCRSALLYDMGAGVQASTYSADGCNILRTYEEFEKKMKGGDYNEFDICLHKNNRGICAVDEGKLLSEDGNGYFCCILNWISGTKEEGQEKLEYAMFVYDPASKKFSKESYFEINEAVFELIFGFIKKVGESIEQ